MEPGAGGGSPWPIVGREAELGRVDEFVAGIPGGLRALVIRGEPGIGKTTLWQTAVERCRGAGLTILAARPVEDEMPLALAGLVDLFERVAPDVRAGHVEPDTFARARAVLAAFRSVADQAPLVVAIDNVQWLDESSAHAIRYALRRLGSAPVGVLVTAGADSGAAEPLRLSSALGVGRIETLTLGPLGLDELRRVVGAVVTSISRPALRRIHQVSGGNPLYAIELARGIEGGGRRREPGALLALPNSLQGAIVRRLEAVPPELVPLLEVVSALGAAGLGQVRELLGDVDVEGLLAQAERRGLLVLDEELHIRFSHPLIGSVVYGQMGPLGRRALHGRLAELAADPDARARHLALSTDDPDHDAAAQLEEAAARAGERGSSDLAAEFARHSLRLTPADEPERARRRALAEIVHLAAAGEASQARALAERLVARLPPGPGRAEVLVQWFRVGNDDLARGDALLVQALEEAGEDNRLRGRVLDILGWLRGAFRGDLRSGIECAREAVALATGMGDADLELLALGHLGHLSALAGVPRPALMERALALTEHLGPPRLSGGPRAWWAKQQLWSGNLAQARSLFEAALAAGEGDELERPHRLYDLALLERAAGNLRRAEDIVGQGLEAALDAEDPEAEWWLCYPLALVQAWLGQGDAARETAARLIEWGSRRGGLPGTARARSVLGVLALSDGDATEAARELSAGAELLERWGFGHPGALPILPDAVEALARSGDRPGAASLLRRLEEESAALGQRWAWAAVERSRGVLSLAAGESDIAVAHLERAAAAFDTLGYRPDAARAVLELGRAMLRSGRRALAADTLADAWDRFEAMGASLWQSRAAEELERAAPGRTTGTLTSTERRVAALVARGMKNREIAEALYMSVATVEAHLTRMYRKLDIRSRSDLALLIGRGELPEVRGDVSTAGGRGR
jgi:DNA-binding CsgD family transcriptional regulator